MDTSETFIKQCEKAEEIQATMKRSPEWGIEIEHHNYYGIHHPVDGYFEMRLDDRYVFNATVGGYVYNEPSFGCAVDASRAIQLEKDWVIWLPRQDQLQEIMFPDPQDSINIQANRITNQFALEDYGDTGCTATYFFTTWEQLWLAFVMKEKFNKVWNGKEWLGS